MTVQEPAVTTRNAPRRPAEPPAAVLTGVTKVFDETVAVDDITLEIESGQLLGLIGPSGCGKTTLVRLLVGVLAPSSGQVRVYGHDPTQLTPAQRAHVGYTPQGFFLYPTLTVLENLRFVAGLFGIPFWRRGRRRRIEEVVRFLELWDARHRLARDLSGGMQRRLELACALIHDPTILFVDEPTAGLDPVLRRKIWEELRALREAGTTIVVTTQHIDEAAHCDRVAVLSHGRLLALASPDDLRQTALQQMAGGWAVLDVEAATLSREDVRALLGLPSVQGMVRVLHPGGLRLAVNDVASATVEIIQALQDRGVQVASVEPYTPTFDEVFMRIVGNGR